MSVSRGDSLLDVFAATIYAEARGETPQGQEWVAHVIKNRAEKNRSYWGGGSVKDVCLHPYQFECWNGRNSIQIAEPNSFALARTIADQVLNRSSDPTQGCDHYNNPSKEGYPEWTRNVTRVTTIGNHVFYRGD